MKEYRLFEQTSRLARRLARYDNGILDETWKEGDIIFFDVGGSQVQVGMIISLDSEQDDLSKLSVEIRQPGGRIRRRNIIHDLNEGTIIKMNASDSKAIKTLYEANR